MLCNWAVFVLLISLSFVLHINGEVFVNPVRDENKIIWCTAGNSEQKKCENFAHAAARDKSEFKRDYLELSCVQGFDKEECMTILDEEKAHITSLDSGEVFMGGRYHSLIPLMQEIYEGGFKYYYAVAVIRKSSLTDVHTISHLRGKKACFAGVGTLAGWVIPIHTLMKSGGMEIIDCNNHVKSTINFFGPSCAINSLIDRYNPIGDNSDKLCQLCTGEVPGGKCTRADPFAGYEGAFRCLVNAGEIAFLKHTTVDEMLAHGDEFSTISKNNFELLCTDGTRKPIDDYRSCNWGPVPSHAIVTTSAIAIDRRQKYQAFIERAIRLYGHKDPNTLLYNSTNPNSQNNYNQNGNYNQNYNSNNQNYNNRNENRFGKSDPYSPYSSTSSYDSLNSFDSKNNEYDRLDPKNNGSDSPIFYEKFSLFESVPKYGRHHNLMFQDNTKDLVSFNEDQQHYANYLGDALQLILGVRHCPVNRMTLCVTSDPEMEKCIKMRTALGAQLLKPEMSCYKGHSQIHCMQAIKSGAADVSVLDAGDIYTAGWQHDLVPFISEIYNTGEPEYYVVAVAREEDATTDLTYLRGKYTCHTGINTAAGWIYPLAYLISNGWIRSYGCNSIRAAAEYFTKSCVPGALSTEYNTGVPYDNMCDLCHGPSYRYCRRDASEDYYGYTGALRCLVEGGGDVAFIKHTTVKENTDSKRREWWARNALTGDFELLCPDGTRAEIDEYKRCNLGKVKANAFVTRGGYGYNETEINAYINLMVYAQQFYGRKEADEFSFSMFYSQPPYADLIFQDAAQQLRAIEKSKRYYSSYLGSDFMRARRIVDCHAGAAIAQYSFFATAVSCSLAMLISKGHF